MAKTPAISDSEWEVMSVLWNAGQAMMASEIVDHFSGEKAWSPKTIKTLLNRLIKKGALTFDVKGKCYLYRAAVSREQCVRAAGRSFLSRVFGGLAGPMLVHFVNHADLSPAEVEEIQQLLLAKKAQTKRNRKR